MILSNGKRMLITSEERERIFKRFPSAQRATHLVGLQEPETNRGARQIPVARKCKTCEMLFLQKRPQQVYCCRECKRAAKLQRRLDQ